ncbi:hypothetical protein R3W88_003652 [Solanum pinnatisectum]|uniref:Serpin domain-containing protein n=1 Tax=Solanum pinnatisectum TaxID=50273 RepID=A0AAV9MSV1_9SOLN|nr:hypothetical protein R3W88_003652 [Solanum pinnatisectum]
MYFILPDAHDGLSALFDKISTQPGLLNHHVRFRKVSVDKFLIPKFKIIFEFEASNILNGLGLTLQMSFIEVNEEGNEAVVVMVTLIMPMSLFIEKEIDFVADHPFIYVPYKR